MLFDRKTIDFGEVEVIKDVSQQISMHNESTINAEFRIYCKRKDAVFKPDITEGKVAPKGDVTITVNAFLKDASRITDTMNIIVQDAP